MDNDLAYLGATEALCMFAERQLSPVELLEAVLSRAEDVEPTVNAFAAVRIEQAYAAAHEAEARWSGRGSGAPRPLEGLPVALKEEQPLDGEPLRLGSLLTEGDIAPQSHPVAERVLAAGAVVHARTTTPEFSCAGFTHSELWGVTRNPWNTAMTPGGSSGGAGATLAAGTTTLATGSDIAGSIRIPSSFCGVLGFKPPYGRVPGLPPFNLDTYCHDGPMGRSVRDVALLQNVIAGAHSVDPVSMRNAPYIPADLEAADGLRVALAITIGDFPIDPEVEKSTRAFGDALRYAGLKVEEVEVPIDRHDVMTAMMIHFGSMFGPGIDDLARGRRELLTPYAAYFTELAADDYATHGYYVGMQLENRVQATIAEVFDRFDALVCPTIGTTGLAAGDDYVDHGITIAGVDLRYYLGAALTPIFNIASRHPVLAVPSGRASNGVPTGVQIAGRTFDDETPFRVAAAAERAMGWWLDPTWRPFVGRNQ